MTREFRYLPEQVHEVVQAVHVAIPADARLSEADLMVGLLALENAAGDYVDAISRSLQLPDRAYLSKRRREQLQQLHAVRELLSPSNSLATALKAGRPALLSEGGSPAKVVCRLFLDGAITYDEVEQYFAAAVVEKLIERTGWDHDLAQKDDRKHEFRQEFLRVVAATWARLIGRPLSECTISAVDGTPMLTFARAAVDPVLDRTGETLGNERLKQILRDIVSDAGGSPSVMDAAENQSLVF